MLDLNPVTTTNFCYYSTLTCGVTPYAKAIDNDVADEAKPAGVRVRLASVVAAQPSYSKSARQAAFSKLAIRLSVEKAVSGAKLIPDVDPVEFRIVRMPG